MRARKGLIKVLGHVFAPRDFTIMGIKRDKGRLFASVSIREEIPVNRITVTARITQDGVTLEP